MSSVDETKKVQRTSSAKKKNVAAKLNCVSPDRQKFKTATNDSQDYYSKSDQRTTLEQRTPSSDNTHETRTQQSREYSKSNTTTVPETGKERSQTGTTEALRNSHLAELIASPCVDDYEPTHQNGPDYVIPTENTCVWNRDDPVKLKTGFANTIEYTPKSIITLLSLQVRKHSTKMALSIKRNGEWLQWSYQKLWNEAFVVAKAFIKLGLQRFHAVGILGFNSPEWFLASLGTLLSGGVLSGIYCTNSANACHYILDHNEANVVIVDNDHQLQKILEIKDRLPHLKAIVQYLGMPCVPGVLSWSDLLEIGESVPDKILEIRIKSIAINQCCTLIYTSGTTGPPKAAMLNHDNLAMTIWLGDEHWHLSEGNGVKGVSFLPLSHVAAQLSDIFVPLCLGGEMTFAQPDAMKGTLVETLREVRPRQFLGVPRVYEKMAEKVKERIGQMGFVKRNLVSWAMRCGYANATHTSNQDHARPSGFLIANKLLRRIKETLGFEDTISWYCGAAPLSKETHRFFQSLNIVILETYGMSECTGPHIMNTRDDFRLGSVGKSSIFQTRVDKPDETGNGEVCLIGRNVFMGYLGMKDKTLEAFDDDGWLHTGDIGRFDKDGFLYITGRIKELIITAGGENIAPVPIEDMVKDELPIISQAVLIGDKRKFLAMLLTLKTDVDVDTMLPLNTLTHEAREWCRSVGSTARTLGQILEKLDQQVMEAIQHGIDRVNENAVSNAQRIQKWAVLPRNFSIPTKELGPTLKLKRQVVMAKYHDVIESFYNLT